jgi:acetate kinase
MKVVVDAAGKVPAATLALEVYVHRLRQAIAAMTAAMGGLDALVFTGGVGEGSSAVRELAVSGLGFLGLSLDRESNVHDVGDRHLESRGSSVAILVLAAREDLQIAFEVRQLLTA